MKTSILKHDETDVFYYQYIMVNKIPQLTYDTLKLDFKQVSKQQHSCIGPVGWLVSGAPTLVIWHHSLSQYMCKSES